MRVEFLFDFGSPNGSSPTGVDPGGRRADRASHFTYGRCCGRHLQAPRKQSLPPLCGIKNKPDYEALETRRFVEAYKVVRTTEQRIPGEIPLSSSAAPSSHKTAGVFEDYVRTMSSTKCG